MEQQDVQARLKEATANCLTCHEEWSKNKKDSKAREKIMEAVHELRKVAARVEIELAVSERDQMASKPIPIPSHRSSQGGRGGKKAQSDDHGNQREQESADGQQQKKSAPRKLPPRRNKTGTDSASE